MFFICFLLLFILFFCSPFFFLYFTERGGAFPLLFFCQFLRLKISKKKGALDMSFQPSSFISDDPFFSLLCIYFFPLKSPIGSNRSILFFLQPFSMSVCTVCITVYYIQIQPCPIVYLLTRYLYTRFTSVLKCLYTMDCLVFIQKRSLKLAGPLGVTNKGFGKAYDRKQMQMRESPPPDGFVTPLMVKLDIH